MTPAAAPRDVASSKPSLFDFSAVTSDLHRASTPWRSHPRATLTVAIWLLMSAMTVGLWLSRMAAAYPHG